MEPSIFKILIVVLLLVLLFGRGKISGFMEDLGKGVNAFKKGLKDGEEDSAREAAKPEEKPESPKQITDARENGNVGAKSRETDKA